MFFIFLRIAKNYKLLLFLAVQPGLLLPGRLAPPPSFDTMMLHIIRTWQRSESSSSSSSAVHKQIWHQGREVITCFFSSGAHGRRRGAVLRRYARWRYTVCGSTSVCVYVPLHKMMKWSCGSNQTQPAAEAKGHCKQPKIKCGPFSGNTLEIVFIVVVVSSKTFWVVGSQAPVHFTATTDGNLWNTRDLRGQDMFAEWCSTQMICDLCSLKPSSLSAFNI